MDAKTTADETQKVSPHGGTYKGAARLTPQRAKALALKRSPAGTSCPATERSASNRHAAGIKSVPPRGDEQCASAPPPGAGTPCPTRAPRRRLLAAPKRGRYAPRPQGGRALPAAVAAVPLPHCSVVGRVGVWVKCARKGLFWAVGGLFLDFGRGWVRRTLFGRLREGRLRSGQLPR